MVGVSSEIACQIAGVFLLLIFAVCLISTIFKYFCSILGYICFSLAISCSVKIFLQVLSSKALVPK